jgi:hypothetical protein
MKPSAALATHSAALRQLFRHYDLTHPCVFGSVVTGSDTEGSDLDLLFEPSDSTTLLTIAGFQIDAETMLGVAFDSNGLPTRRCGRPSLCEAP